MLILQIVVFFSTCDAVDFHYSLFSAFLWPANLHPETEDRQMFLRFKTFQLHGNMKHEDRRSTFQTFKKEKSALLLSTDVAARGLDFPKVRCIIQYDSPGEASEYVHRYPESFPVWILFYLLLIGGLSLGTSTADTSDDWIHVFQHIITSSFLSWHLIRRSSWKFTHWPLCTCVFHIRWIWVSSLVQSNLNHQPLELDLSKISPCCNVKNDAYY